MKKSRKLAWVVLGVGIIGAWSGCAHEDLADKRDAFDPAAFFSSPKNLVRLEEPTFRDLGEDVEMLRLFIEPGLLSNGVIRIQLTEGEGTLVAKRCRPVDIDSLGSGFVPVAGLPGLERKAKTLSKDQCERLRKKLRVCDLSRNTSLEDVVYDGTLYVLELWDRGDYHAIWRSHPEEGAFHDLVAFLKELCK